MSLPATVVGEVEVKLQALGGRVQRILSRLKNVENWFGGISLPVAVRENCNEMKRN